MNKIILAIVCVMVSLSGICQEKYKDAFKVNLSALVAKNISVQYERKISKRLSVALGYRNLPYGTIPFETAISNKVNSSSVDFTKLLVGSNAITPELRWYVGKKGAMRGFYMAPFGSFANYKSEFPISFSNRSGIFKGSMKASTAGIQFGSQFRLASRFYLDWWIIGPNIGNGKGNLDFNADAPLNPNEQSALSDQIAKLKKDLPIDFISTYTVDASGAKIVLDGPWAGLRGLGFCLSFHF